MATEFLNIDSKQLSKYEGQLSILSDFGLPIAIQRTLNDTARAARPIAQEVIRNKMITRNKFTEKRVIYQNGPRTLKINQMKSTIGHTEEYMLDQEIGGSTDRDGKYQTVIPTHFASNESDSASPRRRAVVSGRRLRSIAFDSRKATAPKRQGGAWKSKKQEFLVTGMMAARSGKRYFILHTNNSRYQSIIYRINKTRKISGEKYPIETKAVYFMRTDKTLIRKTRWLEESSTRATKLVAGFYQERLEQQIDRLR